MSFNSRNPRVNRLATKIARLTGETKTQAVIKALSERLERIRRHQSQRSMAEELADIAQQCANLPVRDDRTADEILGYDSEGVPH